MNARRSPVRYALGSVVVLLALGVGVRWWGPMNPATTVTVSGFGAEDGGGIAAPGTDPSLRHLTMTIVNQSQSAVVVTRVRSILSTDPATRYGRRSVPVPVVRSAAALPDQAGDLVSRPLPYQLSGGRSVTLDIVVHVASCGRDPLLDTQYSVVADLRTASGRVKTVGSNYSGSTAGSTCPVGTPYVSLPEPGAQPADPSAARAEIRRAFAVVYDLHGPVGSQAARIDDPRGIDAAGKTAATGTYASNVLGVSVRVDRVVFTSPTTAAVAYDLLVQGYPSFPGRLGHARLVGATWKVTRSTVCADLLLAYVTCPPH